MNLPEICLDDRRITPDVPASLSLTCCVSILDRVLAADNRRIAGALDATGIDVFNPKNCARLLSGFSALRLRSEIIPDLPAKAVVTLAIGGGHNAMLAISRPLMEAYAKAIGADYVVIDQIKLGMSPAHFEKWQMYDLLFKYDRIVFFDADILVSPDCPDLTVIVPRDHVGGYVEDAVSDRSTMIDGIQRKLGDIGWRNMYLNSGMGVYSWLHRPIFEVAQRYVVGPKGDQNMYNYRIQLDRMPVFSLPNVFNRMDLCGADRHGAYVLHYAGKGYTGIKDSALCLPAKLAVMRQDAQIICRAAINRDVAPEKRLPVLLPYFPRRSGNGENCLDAFTPEYTGSGRFKPTAHGVRLPLRDHTLIPFMKDNDCPIGDAIMILPVARAAGMKLFLPRTFAGDLTASLADGVEIVRDLRPETPVYPIVSILSGNADILLEMDNWGTRALISQYGDMNATQCIAAALGISLRDPVPRLRRPAPGVKGRVILFPNGKFRRRSLCLEFVRLVTEYLQSREYEVLSGDRHFDDPAAFAEFVASAEYVIGPFTGPTHLAAAMGVKTVAICVGDSPHAYRLLQPNACVLRSECQRCWTENKALDRRICGEEFSLCQRVHSPRSIFIAMRHLDSTRLAGAETRAAADAAPHIDYNR